MTNNNIVRELKLHSPAGVEPAVFTWPNIEQQVKKSNYLFLIFLFNFYLRLQKKTVLLSVVMKLLKQYV
jgi:hypothetical protein